VKAGGRRSWSRGRRTFRGEAYGSVGETFGEAVFTTAMTGYQETLTDPSYHRQVVVQTAPHIGNTGVNGEDDESAGSGSPVRGARPARPPSNWRATGTWRTGSPPRAWSASAASTPGR
jgi:carbamoyl-phosphate synthase small subunit